MKLKLSFLFCAIGIMTSLSAQNNLNTPEQDAPETYSISVSETRWRLSVNNGLGYRVGSTSELKQGMATLGYDDSAVKRYINDVRWGYNAGGQAYYMLNDSYGLGADYQFFMSSAEIAGYTVSGDQASLIYSKTDETVYNNYLGLSLYAQDWLVWESLRAYSHFSAGLSFYRQEFISLHDPLLISGQSFGTNLGLGMEYFIHSNWSMGAYLFWFRSVLKGITVKDWETSMDVDLNSEQEENLGRVGLSFSIQYYL